MLIVDGINITTDKDGYLKKLSDWSPQVAIELANSENIQLTDQHWEILEVLKKFYQTYEISPSARPLVKAVKNKLGAEKGNSLYLMTLFPDSPPKQAAKIAGLPRPANCF